MHGAVFFGDEGSGFEVDDDFAADALVEQGLCGEFDLIEIGWRRFEVEAGGVAGFDFVEDEKIGEG